MSLNVGKVEVLDIPPIEQSYDTRDTILYALGLGYGSDPVDPAHLQFVYEQGLKAVPSFSSLLAHPGFWLQKPEYGADWVKILHAEQAFEVHAPLPTRGTVRGEYSIGGLEDKGADKGSLIHQIKTIYDTADGRKLATVRSTLFLRGDGGLGEFGTRIEPPKPLPDRKPDRVVDYRTLPQQALIYRLSGDWNPLHADPTIARKAGFTAPILHGLCTNGIACRAVMSAYCQEQPERLAGMFVRFSSPTMPGETIRVEFFEEADGLRFRARALERDVVVLDRASATVI